MAPFISVWSIDIFCWGNSLASPGTRMKDTLINYHLYEDHHTEVIFFCLLHGLSVKLPRKYHFPCERFSNSQLLSWYDKKQSLEKSCVCTPLEKAVEPHYLWLWPTTIQKYYNGNWCRAARVWGTDIMNEFNKIWVILRCWGNSSILCQQNSDAL